MWARIECEVWPLSAHAVGSTEWHDLAATMEPIPQNEHTASHATMLCCVMLCRLDLRDIRVVCKVGGTIDDSELVDGCVFDQKVRFDLPGAPNTCSLSLIISWLHGATVLQLLPWPICSACAAAGAVVTAVITRLLFAAAATATAGVLQAAKTAGGPTRVEKAKIGLIQFHLSPPKADIENTVVISDYAQVIQGL